jgi:hypothetical protein
MSVASAAFIEGVVAGAKAALEGPDACRRLLDAYWLRHSGYVVLPGQTEVRRRTLQEWHEDTDALVQKMTGHNRLPDETPEMRRASFHAEI